MRTGLNAAAIVFASWTACTAVSAQEQPIGENEYRIACAACHGTDARGSGPVAAYLTVPPADLTTLAQRNQGVFPIADVFETIDGRADVSAHGPREMPIWGARYRDEGDGLLGPYGGETAVTARILLLTYYLQTIQQP